MPNLMVCTVNSVAVAARRTTSAVPGLADDAWLASIPGGGLEVAG
jgi:hypothetical protein